MKQLFQNIRSGELIIEEVPNPSVAQGYVRVRTVSSLISAGTEKMIIDLGKKSLLGKAQARPDLARQVLTKARNEGIVNTYKNIKSKLNRPMLLGYSAAGIVIDVGGDISDLSIGDRVAMAGAGYANHAEINVVPRNLITMIPDGVDYDSAAFTTVASIAMQGVRLAKPQIGEYCLVLGLGLIGLITVQILKANGCRVIGVDLSQTRVKLALKIGAEYAFVSGIGDINNQIYNIVGGGVDHTFITAATKSNQPIEFAGEITRRKGQVVIVGAVGLDIPRDSYYHKELSIQVSMSYGPGRYDPSFEEGGIDYPYDYVRWTEQRNMQSVLQLMKAEQLSVKKLITHQYSFQDALSAYGMIEEAKTSFIGVILNYGSEPIKQELVITRPEVKIKSIHELIIGFIGAGNYASLQLLPRLQSSTGVILESLVSNSSTNVKQKAVQFKFRTCSTNSDDIISSNNINTVFIAGRHSTHADLVIQSLKAGKHVFVEKPLVTSIKQLKNIEEVYSEANQKQPIALMVGLNRRFAPMVVKMLSFFQGVQTVQMIYRVNSGFIPNNTWLHEKKEGGGMLVGEMCHFIDLMQFISKAHPISVYAKRLILDRKDLGVEDNLSLSIGFSNGSTGVLVYNTIGDKDASKERLEVYGGGRVGILDDFRHLSLTHNNKTKTFKKANQDKGQSEQIAATIRMFKTSGTSPIPFTEIASAMYTIFAGRESLRTGLPIEINQMQNYSESEH